MTRALRLLAAILAAALVPLQAASAQAPAFRVVSYNIRYDAPQDDPNWAFRAPRLTDQLAFLDADVIGLQEALAHQADQVAGALPDYDRYGVGRDDGALGGETTTVLWRRDRFEVLARDTRWCSPTPERPSRGWDADLPRTVTRVVLRDRASGVVLDVRNTHFDHIGAEARLQCARQIADMAPALPDARVVVMGDLNTGPDTAPHQALVAAGLEDARSVSPVVFGPSGTANGFDIRRGEGEAPIDHILVGTGWRVSRFATLTDSIAGRVISDHYPVVADIVAVTLP